MILENNSFMEVNRASLSSDTKRGYAGMPAKTGFLLIDNDKRLIRDHAHNLREALFACTTQPQVESAVAFARYLNYAGLSNDNYWLFLRMIMTNNPWVIDELLHDRTARLLFSTIRPGIDLLDAAFEMLYSRHPDEIYSPALEAVLGIIQNAYFDPDDGYRIRKLSIMDIHALGKFLIKDEPQEHPLNKLILEILDRIAHVGDYYGEQDKNVLSKHAFNVRYAYFDHTRELVDAIPEPLLVRLQDRMGVHPEDDYVDLVSKRRQRKRDVYGRFVKETDAVPEIKVVNKTADESGKPDKIVNESVLEVNSEKKPELKPRKTVRKLKNATAKSKSSKTGTTKSPK